MQNQMALVSLDEVKTLGEVFVKSGFFSDARDASQAIVKILAGRELGFSPIASMTGVYIVKGKPSLSANMIAARIKLSGRYDYRVKEHDATRCAIEFFAVSSGARESLGTSTFTIEDAKKAGTQNIEKFPRNMLFARAMSNGARWFCPDAFAGVAPYTPDELGAQVETDENGDTVKVIDAQPTKEQPTRTLPPLEKLPDNFTLREYLANVAKSYTRQPTDEQLAKMRGLLAGTLTELCGNDDKRHAFIAAIYPESEGSTNGLPYNWVGGLLNWLSLEKRLVDGRNQYAHTAATLACGVAIGEFMREQEIERGQIELPK